MPTNTDLVTDLPADFEVFGQAVDTSMADLKGGTTGQILSKATNTDMDFTWITNDVGDITAVTATSPLTGGGTSGAITVGIQDATTSVKGSVQLSDSTSTTSSVLASTPTAVKSAYDLAASAYAAGFTNSYPAGKNRVLNSNYSVWQRGTSFANPGNGYTADRWIGSTATAGTITRQLTNDSTNLPNIQYCLRYQRTAASTSTSLLTISQSFETVNSIPLAGKAVTLSFYARAGANYSATSNGFTVALYTGTGTDQNVFLTGYTGSAQPINQLATLTTTWQRFTYTATLSASATEVGLIFFETPSGTAGAADYYEITGVQLEVGSTASPYAPNGATYQAELAACQRYYQRITAEVAYQNFGTGFFGDTTNARVLVPYKTTMRVAPSFATSGSFDTQAGFTSRGTAAPTLVGDGTNTQIATLNSVVSGATAAQAAVIRANNSTSTYIEFSSEL